MKIFDKTYRLFKKETKKFKFIKKLLRLYPKAEIYLVGGVVRDLLLARESKDYDFIVAKVKIEELKIALEKMGRVDLVGKTFGVFKFTPKKGEIKNIDIALPRTEHGLGTGGYRDFEVQADPNLPIEKDLARRDFTINAMAWDIKNGKLIDLYSSQDDLNKKIIKTVGKSENRFSEDYSRMLRGIRFACQLNFKIEEKTWQAIKKLISKINQEKTDEKGEKERVVPYEVIAKEILKALTANPAKALELLDQSKILKELMPELLKMKSCPQPENWHSEGDVWQHTLLSLEKLHSEKFKKQFSENPEVNSELILATIFHDAGKPYTIETPEEHGTERIQFYEHDRVGAELAEKICRRLKFSSFDEAQIDPEKISWLVKKHLLTVHGKVLEMKNKTIEKYFFNPNYPGLNLLKLIFADSLATVPPSGQPDLTTFHQLFNRIQELKELGKEKKELPKPLLNGNEIIKEFNLKPGPQVGQLLDLLREEQLSQKIKTKKQALEFLKKNKKG